MPFQWNDTTVADLKRRHEAGESASEIARAIGTTRNAVCGKVHRLHMVERRPGAKAKYAPRPRMMKAPLHKGRVFILAPPVNIERAPLAIDASNSRQIDIMQLTESTCHFAFGDVGNTDFGFCGHPTTTTKFGAVSAYCAHHHAICHGPGTVSERNVVSRKMLEAAE